MCKKNCKLQLFNAYFIIINNHVESDRAFSAAEIITFVMPVCHWEIVLVLLAAHDQCDTGDAACR